MPYIPPCLDTLRGFPQKFTEIYKESDPKKLSLIAFYCQIVELTQERSNDPENLINVLTGWEVFLMANIKYQDNKGKSPSTKKSTFGLWWNGKGDEFYTYSKAKFNINKKNKFPYEERLFFLFEFYQWIESNYTEENLNKLANHPLLKEHNVKLIFESKKQLLEEIDKASQSVLDRNKAHLISLVNSIPVLSALTKSMGKLETLHQEKSRNPGNPKRLEAFNFIQFIMESYPKAKNNFWPICSGTILIVLLEIDNVEYKYWKWLRSSKNSSLFTDGLTALNQEDLTKIPIDQKIWWLKSLTNHLLNLMDDKTNYEKILSETITKIKKRELTVIILDNQIRSFHTKINGQLKTLEKERETPSLLGYAVSSMASYSVQYGLTTAADASKGILGSSFNLAGLFANASGPLRVLALFGGGLLTEKILEVAAANLFAYVIEKIASSVGSAAYSVVTNSFSPTPQGLQEIREKLPPEEDKIFVRMVNTMLKLKIISKEDKEHMREALDLKVGEELQLLNKEKLTEEEINDRNEMLSHGFVCKVNR